MELLKDRICCMEKEENDGYSLFTELKIDVEYMTADRDTLDAIPAADRLLETASGKKDLIYYPYGKDEGISWSTVSAGYAVKFKIENKNMTFRDAETVIYKEIKRAGLILEEINAVLLPTAVHPWLKMNNNIIKHVGDNIAKDQKTVSGFDESNDSCLRNFHLMHLYLPFKNDREFFRLHTAVRLILPLIPALSSSSPIIGNAESGKLDNRLEVYKNSCLYSVEDPIIPEPYSGSEKNKIKLALNNNDNVKICSSNNMCGISADFDKGIIDLGMFEIQESLHADISIARFITLILEFLVNCGCGAERQAEADTAELSDLMNSVLSRGMFAVVENKEYLEMLGIKKQDKMSLWGIWMHFSKTVKDYAGVKIPSVENILKTGSLSERIIKSIENSSIHDTYKKLYECLKENKMMIV